MVPAVQSRSDLLTFGNVRPDPATERVDSAFFSGSIGAATDFSLALNASSVRLFDDIANFAGDASPFQGLEFASAPQLTLVGRGDGATDESYARFSRRARMVPGRARISARMPSESGTAPSASSTT